jgi:MGT family glycosyltransferase
LPKALFFNIPATGHVNPSLALVRELLARGEEIRYFNVEAFRAKIESAGIPFVPYAVDVDFASHPGGNPVIAMAHIAGYGEQLLPSLLDVARAEQPDYILYDSMTPWGPHVAAILGVPAICSCTILLIHSQNADSIPRRLLTRQLSMAGMHRSIGALWRYWQIHRRLRRSYGVGLPAVPDFFANPGDLTLVYTSRLFQPGGDLLDDSFRFVGPSIAKRPHDAEFPFDHLDGGPVIYVSLGTIFNERPDFFRNCIAAFGNSSYRVVLSVGNSLDLATLGDVPENVLVRRSVPQLELLERADLFFTHGGMNSVSESLWFGVPVIVFPQIGDQFFVSHRVEELGAGVTLTPDQIDPNTLRAQAERILANGTFRTNAARLRESLRAAGGYAAAADEVMRFVDGR